LPLTLTLKPGREKSVRQRHPWLFSGSVSRRTGESPEGIAEVRDAAGGLLGRAFVSPSSSLVARLWTFGEEPLDAGLVARRFDAARRLRASVVPPDTDGYRLVHAEGDGLPGLVVDRYGDVLVVQATTEGTERARPLWLPPLAGLLPSAAIVQRNGVPSREGEGLATEDELLAGAPIPARVPFLERGLRFLADVAGGQKTGFFLDQRENRHLVRRSAAGRRTLNLFSYSGAFGVAALAGGAREVTEVDVSPSALELARENHEANGQGASVAYVAADVFEGRRRRVSAGESWDLLVTVPPAFARRRDDVDRACRGYKDVNRLAMKLLSPGGLLLACSCSGAVSAHLFQQVLFSASLEAGASMQLLSRHGAGPDHPVSLDVPEGEYLKAFLLRRP